MCGASAGATRWSEPVHDCTRLHCRRVNEKEFERVITDLEALVRSEISSEDKRCRQSARGTFSSSIMNSGESNVTEMSNISRKWYRDMASRFHPDHGGSNAAMIAISEGHQRLDELLGQAVIGNNATEKSSVAEAGGFALVSPAAVKLWLVLSQAGSGNTTHGEAGSTVRATDFFISSPVRSRSAEGSPDHSERTIDQDLSAS